MTKKASPLENVEKVVAGIRKIRELKGITREQLADDLGMSVSGYSKIERGEIELTLLRLYQIAEALDFSLPQIIEFSSTQPMLFEDIENAELEPASLSGISFHVGVARKYIARLEEEVRQLRSQLITAP